MGATEGFIAEVKECVCVCVLHMWRALCSILCLQEINSGLENESRVQECGDELRGSFCICSSKESAT